MSPKSKSFNDADKRIIRFEKHFNAQNIIGNLLDEIFDCHEDKLKIREGDERDLSILIGCSIAKAIKSFTAIRDICSLGYGEDALILLRSNINLLINIAYIVSSDDPKERALELLAFSYRERVKYFEVRGIKNFALIPDWKAKMTEEDYNAKADKWKKTHIDTKAKNVPEMSPFHTHYNMGYKLYSSYEHSDAVAIYDYIAEWNEKGPFLRSEPSDKYIEASLGHSFIVMSEIISWYCKYFDIDSSEIMAKCQATLKELNKEKKTT